MIMNAYRNMKYEYYYADQHIFQYGIVSLRQTQLWCVCGKEPEDLRPS